MNYTIRKSLILNNWYRTFLKNIHPLEHKALMNRTSTEASLSYESLLHRCGLLQRLWSKSEGIGALTLWLWSIWFWSSELGSSTTTQDAHYKIMKRSCIVVAVLYVNYLLSQIHIAFPKIAWTALIKKKSLTFFALGLGDEFPMYWARACEFFSFSRDACVRTQSIVQFARMHCEMKSCEKILMSQVLMHWKLNLSLLYGNRYSISLIQK